MPRRGLYPPIEPVRHGHLAVSHGHEIYYEECGNPQGKPVVFLHGGPGRRHAIREQRRFFDPARYRIVLFDQRGCGTQPPAREPRATTRPGTWSPTSSGCASTSASSAGRCSAAPGARRWRWPTPQTHPERVTELVLRGIFLLRKSELEWFYQEGASALFPDRWEHYLAPIPPSRARRPDARLPPAPDQRPTRGARWPRRAPGASGKARTSYLHPDDENVARTGARTTFALAFARIECHYFVNGGFLEREEPAARDVDAHPPHPRRDRAGPLRRGLPDGDAPGTLHRAWPEAELRVVADAGPFGVRARQSPTRWCGQQTVSRNKRGRSQHSVTLTARPPREVSL